jgi:Rrf2 family iron-sulfur cluster assembly transcriptional regulator
MSRRYLDQLAVGLKNASLIRGIAGKGGGYVLVNPAEQIKIGQVIEATIGTINIVECVGRPDTCVKADRCECRMLYKAINDRITCVLDEISLADLAFGDMGGVCSATDEDQQQESSDEQGTKGGQRRDPCCGR